MGRHIIERLIVSVPVLLGVLLIGFLLLQVVPSDPAAVIAGPTASQDEIDRIREALGLNEPLWYQFGNRAISAAPSSATPPSPTNSWPRSARRSS